MDSVKETFTTIMAGIEERMAAFEMELQKTAKNPSSTPTLATLTSDFENFKTFVMSTISGFRCQIGLLAHQVDSMEMRARRKMLLFHGVPELKDEDTVQSVVDVVAGYLKMEGFSGADIRRCHRMGSHAGAKKPRPILVKFQLVDVRDKLWFVKSKFKGSGVTVSEFITKPRHEVFMAARERFGVSKCWTREGYIFVLDHNGARHRIVSLSELNRLDTTQKKVANERVTTKSRRVINKK